MVVGDFGGGGEECIEGYIVGVGGDCMFGVG